PETPEKDVKETPPEKIEIVNVDPAEGARNVSFSSSFRIAVTFNTTPVDFENKLSINGSLNVDGGTLLESPDNHTVVYRLVGTPTGGGNSMVTLGAGIKGAYAETSGETEELEWDITFFDANQARFNYPATGG